MSRKQLWVIYGLMCFFLIWGWNLVDSLKFQGKISWKDIISPFYASQIVYMLTTLLLTRRILRRFYPAKKYFLAVLSLLGLIFFFIALRYSLEEVLYPLLFNMRNYPEKTNIIYYGLDNVYYAIVYIILGSLVFLLDHQLNTQKNQTALKQESIKAELAFLRSQVSPHFLFNSLNNIYSLSYKKSDKAPDAILKLSELARYMLYEKHDYVPLEKEWEYIQNFISLQQLRYDAPLCIQSNIKVNIQPAQVAPYLLIPFIENAFKHGDLKDKEHPLQIDLECNEKEIIFTVKNKIGFQQKDKDGGIGLENVRRRLQLLYVNDHILNINKQRDTFDIYLKLNSHGNKNSGSR